jgi:hypothetical protein
MYSYSGKRVAIDMAKFATEGYITAVRIVWLFADSLVQFIVDFGPRSASVCYISFQPALHLAMYFFFVFVKCI